ncbi:MAG: hypothetical protein JW852_07050 [Spirochaetales bacterium]|nr:hypothetical protein [Spirochaetales bacterium]
MPESNYEFEQFFNRDGFNKSLGHFKAVSGLLADFEGRFNLADILNALLGDGAIKQNQLSPILYSLLVDKYGYKFASHNMKRTIEQFDDFQKEVRKWKAIDMIIAYHHPELGFTIINPKNEEHWKTVQTLKRNELVILYAGSFSDELEEKTANTALKTCIAFLEGKSFKTSDVLLKGRYSFKPYSSDEEDDEEEETATGRPAPARPAKRRSPARASFGDGGHQEETETQAESPSVAASVATATAPAAAPVVPEASGGARRMTPMYSVPVTNELFHNGNVEAWKKIIQSYETKYPGCEVSVFYEGEKIHDINTLFKWGKVKHGSTILFAILGNDIKDVAKLQRYLRQGASPQFEAFLRFPVNTVLKLF